MAQQGAGSASGAETEASAHQSGGTGNIVYDALLRNRRLEVIYNPLGQDGSKTYEINPLGLVLKDGVTYLVCSMWDYPDIRLLTLHRMQQASPLDIPVTVPDSFELDAYIASGELNFGAGGMIRLQARFWNDVVIHLEERPLSDDQTLVTEEYGSVHCDCGHLTLWF